MGGVNMHDPILHIYHEPGASFVFEIHGPITVDALQQIERDINEQWDDRPDGTYIVRAHHEGAETNDHGRTMVPAYWDIDVIEFHSHETPAQAETPPAEAG